MTELAHIATRQYHGAEDTIIDRYLELPEGEPYRTAYTVYARATEPSTEGDNPRVCFALERDATEWYTRGVRWGFREDEADYGLFLGFVLLDGIAELAPPRHPGASPMWFSTLLAPGSAVDQLCCAPPRPGERTRYHFRARLSRGGYVDPVIVVHPINTMGDEDDHAEPVRLSLAAPRADHAHRSVVRAATDPNLPLGGSFTVNVTLLNGKPVFSLPPTLNNMSPPQFSGGVEWGPSMGIPGVTITFQYQSTQILSLSSTQFTFSGQTTSGTTVVQSCSFVASSAPQSPSFTVNLATGEHYDPVIVIHPINTI